MVFPGNGMRGLMGQMIKLLLYYFKTYCTAVDLLIKTNSDCMLSLSHCSLADKWWKCTKSWNKLHVLYHKMLTTCCLHHDQNNELLCSAKKQNLFLDLRILIIINPILRFFQRNSALLKTSINNLISVVLDKCLHKPLASLICCPFLGKSPCDWNLTSPSASSYLVIHLRKPLLCFCFLFDALQCTWLTAVVQAAAFPWVLPVTGWGSSSNP